MADSIDELKSYFYSKFLEIKKDFCKQPEAVSVKPISVKSKGAQVQINFNCELLTLVRKLELCFDHIESCEASDLCHQLTKKLNHRNKLIRLADKSPAGWLTVTEYEQDDLASDDEDNKNIKNAEKAALNILKERDENRSPNPRPSLAQQPAPRHVESTTHKVIDFEVEYSNTHFVFETYNEYKDFFEIQENKFSNKISVKGRLKKNIKFWDEIGANSYIKEVIKNGYSIPSIHTPEPNIFKNDKSALHNMSFVLELLDSGRILEVPFQPLVVNPLSVSVKRSGKKRLILDLRHVNTCIWKEKMRFEDIELALDYVEKGGFMFKSDLTSGYHHIDISTGHQTFLGFSVKHNNSTRYFVFTVLPFGLCSAGFIFTKVFRELVKYWRTHGIKIIVYLDDGWSTNSSFHETFKDSDFVQYSLDKSGFLANNEKSVWVPVRILTWLGHNFNLQSGYLKVTDERVDNLKTEIICLKTMINRVTSRRLAKVTGMIASMHFVLSNLTQLMTRFIYKKVNESYSWDYVFTIIANSPEIKELDFWLDNINSLNSRNLFPIFQDSISVYSNASDIVSATYSSSFEGCIMHKQWTDSEKVKSSTWRELKCIEWGIRAFSKFLGKKRVQWYTDNKNCEIIVKSGSTTCKHDLHLLALSIFNFCISKEIVLSVSWIPRKDNEIADSYSRMFDADDMGVSTEFFTFMNDKWGPFSVDRFANFSNRQTTRFNSKFWNPECETVDAFSTDWSGENNWLVPPVNLVCRSILHLTKCRSVGTLVVPRWQSAAFWPLIFEDEALNWRQYVKDVLEFYDSSIFVPGTNKKSLLGLTYFHCSILAIQLDASM